MTHSLSNAGAGVTLEYYKTQHDRSRINNRNGNMNSVVHLLKGYDNACECRLQESTLRACLTVMLLAKHGTESSAKLANR